MHKADNLTAICEPIVYKMWEPQLLTPLWAFMACYRDSFTFIFYVCYIMIQFHITFVVVYYYIMINHAIYIAVI
jgi:hypothetical protein